MPSKLKLRRQRRLREDVAWWRAEAMDCKARLLELAKLLEEAKRQRVPMPVLVTARIIKQMAPATSEPEICLKCNDGARLGCSSCAYRLK
ncbi:hypothetical protein PF050_14045 [Kosakonia pseudosacchari]|uniref:hypothetical protein n=1 Tax=Kosakonia TaxID=1330547 RepID=UPI0022F140CF|nr:MULTISPECIES: hypothetical protein [Kosakonia]WBU47613.1 hypothetical protein PF050_14045 [Kosakonia pseudosacchari]